MQQGIATLAVSALSLIQAAGENGETVDQGALMSVVAGLQGLLRAGLEPTDAQIAAVQTSIDLMVQAPQPAPVEPTPVEPTPVEPTPVEPTPAPLP